MAFMRLTHCICICDGQDKANINDTDIPLHRRPTPTEDGEIKKPDTSAYKESSADDEKPANTSTFQDPLDDDFDFSDDLNFEISELSKTRAASEHQPPERPILRLVPRTGRTVHVGRNVDVARSFKLLALQIAQNKLRQDFQRQRFHERPGLKRKRLKSQRWQKRFKIGFKEAIKRVKELTRQGW
ncbi:hypothetical protein AAE478_001525 [Parahypoxylon ruwenzoriense]